MSLADVVPSLTPSEQPTLAAIKVGIILALVMAFGAWLIFRQRRLSDPTRIVRTRPPGALPPCTVCGADACSHERIAEAEPGVKRVGIDVPPDGVVRALDFDS